MKITNFLRKAAKMFMLACAMSMFMIFGAITLPTNPSPAQATVGKNYLLYINTGTATTPVWTLIGGQKASTLTRKGASIDASDKTTGGWTSSLVGLLSWSISLDGLVKLQDTGYQALELAFNAGQQINVQLVYSDLTYRTGWGVITELTLDNQYNQAATIKGTIEGSGALSALYPNVTPCTATVSKAAATDLSFTIAPSTQTISSVMNGATALTLTTHYTYSAGALVIKAAYWTSLSTGTQTITVNFSDSTSVTIVVTETA
jgi:TP901-1 family phage major tail protein